MTRIDQSIPEKNLGTDLVPGAKHYRAYVGPPDKYDLVAAMQFNLLTTLGLRQHHYLLDIGCGSLRAGRLFIPYLLPDRYFGIEPSIWLVEEGVAQEIGRDQVRIKRPTFSYDSNFTLSEFGKEFEFLVAQSIFSHASEAQIVRCLIEAGKVMTQHSVFVATFVESETNYVGGEWVYPGCVSYRFDFFERLADRYGLTCVRLGWHHPNNQIWIALALKGGRTVLPVNNPTEGDRYMDCGSGWRRKVCKAVRRIMFV